MQKEVILAGFGGQGILSGGQIIAHAAMVQGLNVTYFPSYGGEVRGGTANCTVVISEKKIGSPVVNRPLSAIILNPPSLDRFGPAVKPSGHIFVNSSLISRKLDRNDAEVFYVPANELARGLGDERMATLVMVGAYIGKTGVVSIDSMREALKYFFSKSKNSLVDLNEKAILAGGNSIA